MADPPANTYLFILFPSFNLEVKRTFLSEYLKASFAKLKQPTIQLWLEIIFALIFLLFFMSLVVMSPEGLKSSDMACFTRFLLITF